MSRERTTWMADRKASAAPALPGYGTEDQGHPAHYQDPDKDAYKNGDPDSWMETPNPPPYPQGNPPAAPGYDVEDKDHPAHIPMPRVPKEATMSLKAMVEHKATKALRVAKLMLRGCTDPVMVEDTALDLMDVPDETLDSMYARFGGGFLAEEAEEPEMDAELAALLAEDEEDPVMSRIKAMEEELASLKAAKKAAEEDEKKEEEKPEEAKKEAGEVPPQFQENVDKKKEEAKAKKGDEKEEKKAAEEEGEKKEEAEEGEEKTASSNKTARDNFSNMLASMDTDNDGFLTKADWTGNKAMFASLDTDRDGIISVKEATDMFFAEEDEDLTPEEQAQLAELEMGASRNDPHAFKAEEDDVAGMFSMSDDPMGLGADAESDEMLDEIFGCKVAKKDEKKAEDDEDEAEDEDEDEIIMESSKKSTKKAGTQTPQRPKPSQGPKTLGSQTRVASSKGANDLSSLWSSDPDVSAVFGVPPTAK